MISASDVQDFMKVLVRSQAIYLFFGDRIINADKKHPEIHIQCLSRFSAKYWIFLVGDLDEYLNWTRFS